MKTKTCHTCKKATAVAYRVRLEHGGSWVFVCKDCCNLHREQPEYTYGGTWKGARH